MYIHLPVWVIYSVLVPPVSLCLKALACSWMLIFSFYIFTTIALCSGCVWQSVTCEWDKIICHFFAQPDHHLFTIATLYTILWLQTLLSLSLSQFYLHFLTLTFNRLRIVEAGRISYDCNLSSHFHFHIFTFLHILLIGWGLTRRVAYLMIANSPFTFTFLL